MVSKQSEGYEKVIGNDTPIIILTAYDWADIAEEAKEAGSYCVCIQTAVYVRTQSSTDAADSRDGKRCSS